MSVAAVDGKTGRAPKMAGISTPTGGHARRVIMARGIVKSTSSGSTPKYSKARSQSETAALILFAEFFGTAARST
jgi:hypothetical protein